MSEQKEKIIETIGRELPRMDNSEKTYLMGFLEGFAAFANNQQTQTPDVGRREMRGA